MDDEYAGSLQSDSYFSLCHGTTYRQVLRILLPVSETIVIVLFVTISPNIRMHAASYSVSSQFVQAHFCSCKKQLTRASHVRSTKSFLSMKTQSIESYNRFYINIISKYCKSFARQWYCCFFFVSFSLFVCLKEIKLWFNSLVSY